MRLESRGIIAADERRQEGGCGRSESGGRVSRIGQIGDEAVGPVFRLKGGNRSAQGNALGLQWESNPLALKGRNKNADK